jgi:hypothetical protein
MSKHHDPIWAEGYKAGHIYGSLSDAMEECSYDEGTKEYDTYLEGADAGVQESNASDD